MPRHVVLGVGGGISAYKACELLRRLTESGCETRVVPTPDALRFVGAVTWAALSGRPATTDMWTDVHEVPHVRLGQWADLVFVAPATADLLSRAAAGRSDDLLTATLLMARCPVVFAPAMHTEMWQHPATQASVALLRERGALVIEPATGRLTGPDSGPGRLPEPAELAEVAFRVLDRGASALRPDLAGRRVVISAGGTREELDPVRFLGNWSSGRQGYALARTAVARGAEVTLVSANVALDEPAGAKVVKVVSAAQLGEAMAAAAAGADAVVMAAAVADFRPAARARWSWASAPRPRTCSPTAGPSSPARAAICSSSTRSATASRLVPAITKPSFWVQTAASRKSRVGRRNRSPTRCGISFRPDSRNPGETSPGYTAAKLPNGRKGKSRWLVASSPRSLLPRAIPTRWPTRSVTLSLIA